VSSKRAEPPTVTSWLDQLRGHTATLGPFFSRTLRPAARPATEAWSALLDDPDVGPVRLSGLALRRPSEAGLLVVHGLGGSAESGYMVGALREAERMGMRCLLLSTRGSDRSGQDFAHAGLGADLDAALASDFFSDVSSVDLLGYSLGGHLVLSYAAKQPHPKVRRVAAIGAPLLLEPTAARLDAAWLNLYRTHVIRSLHEIYTVAYQRNPRGIVPEQARRIQRFREWDERVIAPRFGFAGASDYYRQVSAGPLLGELKVDALYVGAPRDPMVPPAAVLPALPAKRCDVVWDRSAGHLGFGASFDLGLAAPLGLEPQVLAWLAGAARRDAPR
jgi:predicted alpha/beta-fold hydrolase